MFFAHDNMSVPGGLTRRLMSPSALPGTLLLAIGSLLLPKRL
jgi:hypothetical protein